MQGRQERFIEDIRIYLVLPLIYMLIRPIIEPTISFTLSLEAISVFLLSFKHPSLPCLGRHQSHQGGNGSRMGEGCVASLLIPPHPLLTCTHEHLVVTHSGTHAAPVAMKVEGNAYFVRF